MVSCRSTVTQIACAGGALAGVFLYTGTGSELNVADGEQCKVQIITNAYTCDDTGYVPTEYCLDWGDGTQTTGAFPTGMAVPRNVELPHVYRYTPTGHSTSNAMIPSVTIFTACGGTRTSNTTDNGRSLTIYVQQPGTFPMPSPTMANYKRHVDFSTASCAGIFPDCSGNELSETCRNGYKQKCIEGFWALDYSRPCEQGGGGTTDSCTGETKCVNGILYKYCTQNGQTGWIGTGSTCGGGTTVTQEGATRCVGNNGQRFTGGVWVNDSTISCGGTGNGDITNPPVDDGSGGDDIMATIMDFYNNNKLVSILGIALLGGVVLFGGKK